ncbi:MAG: hypothetical protein RPU35_06600 [Candidatus Sedimenticola sp. (ex Thyasira tokunagai)]
MKVLITHQFNQAMLQLNTMQQQEVSSFYSFVSTMEKEDILSSALLTRIASKEEGIYTLRGKHVRIFCTFDEQDNILFLDVGVATSPQFIQPEEKTGETTLFGSKGDPKAYIAWDDENTIYSFNGKPLAYIDEELNIYGFNGKHLGWFEEDVVWNHQGQRVGFTSNTCPVYTQFEPFKGFKQFKPFKGFKQYAPFKPYKGTIASQVPLLDFLEGGRS